MHDAGVQLVHSTFTAGDALSRWVHNVQDDICRQQVEALAAAGHRQLAYGMPEDDRLRSEIELRRDGVLRACADLGLPRPVISAIPTEVEGAAAIIDGWRAARRPVTGLCAYDDPTALTMLAALRDRGLAAPGDLAVIGVYDIPTARLAQPPLTTIAIDSQAQARHAASVLIRQLDGKPALRRPGPHVTRLVARDTI
nr:LacI family DNA-binding transcriptional regulator [Kribbella solani]